MPREKTPQRMTLRLMGRRARINNGSGMRSIIRSEEMLKTEAVIM